MALDERPERLPGQRSVTLRQEYVLVFRRPREQRTHFADFWLPHTMAGAAAAQRYVSGLGDDRKAALREQLRVSLPFAADGSLHLIDRVWAVRGTKRTG